MTNPSRTDKETFLHHFPRQVKEQSSVLGKVLQPKLRHSPKLQEETFNVVRPTYAGTAGAGAGVYYEGVETGQGAAADLYEGVETMKIISKEFIPTTKSSPPPPIKKQFSPRKMGFLIIQLLVATFLMLLAAISIYAVYINREVIYGYGESFFFSSKTTMKRLYLNLFETKNISSN